MRDERVIVRVAVVASAFLVACSPGGTANADAESLTQADIEEIRAVERQFVAADLARDIERSLALRTADVVWMAPGAAAAEGKDALRRLFEAAPRTLEFEVVPLRTEGRGDLAYNRGTYSVVALAGQDTIRDHGKYLQIWRRESDAWRLAVEIFNSDVAPGQ